MALRNKEKTIAKKVAVCGMMIALAFIFSYLESLIPISFGIPGIKLGLANLVVLSCLFLMPKSEVFLILIARILLAGFLFGSGMMILYSLAGGILSFCVMSLIKKTDWFSAVGVSICGGVSHNIGQLIVAVIAVESLNLMYYAPILLISGALTGAMIGILERRCERVFRRIM